MSEKRIYTYSLMLLIAVFIIPGCGLKNTNPPIPLQNATTNSTQDTATMSFVDMINNRQLPMSDPTMEGYKIWLDTFLETAQSIRDVTKNFYLHDKTEYRGLLIEQNDVIFNRLLFDSAEFESAVDLQKIELRERLIKSLLLVVQIRIDVGFGEGNASEFQKNLTRENVELLHLLARNRRDIDIKNLNLPYATLEECLAGFDRILNIHRQDS